MIARHWSGGAELVMTALDRCTLRDHRQHVDLGRAREDARSTNPEVCDTPREREALPNRRAISYRGDPTRALSTELRSLLRAGYLRGADLWHVACALYMARESEDVTFITLDQRQAEVAAALGFRLD